MKSQKRIAMSEILPALLKRARRREATACGRVAQFDCGRGFRLENGPVGAHILGMAKSSRLLATALAVLVLPTAAEAYTPEGQQACTGDAFRLCSAEIPNVDRVRACLHRNKAQLSPGCRGFISPGAHRPRPSGR